MPTGRPRSGSGGPRIRRPRWRIRDLVDVVDEDVDAAVTFTHDIEHRSDLLVVAVICLHAYAMPACFVDLGRRTLDRELTSTTAAAGDIHRGTLLAERDGDTAAHSSRCAGDDGDFPGESS